jgi:enediyne polyketide synthase
LLVTFSSIIARTGLPGEAHYAVANEWLARLTERFQADHPACRCLAIEWSVWADLGMGARLGQLDGLIRRGITPIPPDEGTSILRRLVAQPPAAVSVVITGRFGTPPTLSVEQPDLPFLRFLDQPKVYYPGVELVVDAQISAETDPYVDDHVFQGQRLLPGVIGLEAMAQAVMAVVGASQPPVFEDVKFNRPLVVPDGESVTIRVAALVRESGYVDVVLRSNRTAFQVDHFQARCPVGGVGPISGMPAQFARDLESEVACPPIEPEHDLYGRLLFHGGRFRRLRGYRRLRARECVAEIAPDGETTWFARYLPAGLVLGDPATRDAAVHSIQACIPHATILPVGVERLEPSGVCPAGPSFVHTRERARDGDTFIYDLEISGGDGYVRERWTGLHVRRVGDSPVKGPWMEPLLGPYIERRVQELVPESTVSVVVERATDGERRQCGDRAIQRAIGETATVLRRRNGKPYLADERMSDVSAAHAANLVLAVAGPGPLGCDIEPVVTRSPAVWRDLLGPQRCALAEVIVQDTNEDPNAAATRVWAAAECLKKAALTVDTPLALVSCTVDGWAVLMAGRLAVATLVTTVRGNQGQLALAVLVGSVNARL